MIIPRSMTSHLLVLKVLLNKTLNKRYLKKYDNTLVRQMKTNKWKNMLDLMIHKRDSIRLILSSWGRNKLKLNMAINKAIRKFLVCSRHPANIIFSTFVTCNNHVLLGNGWCMWHFLILFTSLPLLLRSLLYLFPVLFPKDVISISIIYHLFCS